LGKALSSLGEHERNAIRFEDAINAYDLALSVITRSESPHEWAILQTDRALARSNLGILRAHLPTIENAHRQAQAALALATKKQDPGATLYARVVLQGITERLEAMRSK
jgi:hypothetical protein